MNDDSVLNDNSINLSDGIIFSNGPLHDNSDALMRDPLGEKEEFTQNILSYKNCYGL
jgi:hypothetical protein